MELNLLTKDSEKYEKQIELVKIVTHQLRNDLGRSLFILDLDERDDGLISDLDKAGDRIIRVNQTASEEHLSPVDLALGFEIFCFLDEKMAARVARANIALFSFPTLSSYLKNSTKLEIFPYQEMISTLSKQIFVFCSHSYWYAKGKMCRFEPQPPLRELVGTADRTRRYYFTANHILKHLKFTGKKGSKMRDELTREVLFIAKKSPFFNYLPKLIDSHIGKFEGWMLREKLAGCSLREMILKRVSYKPQKVLEDILKQLIGLESKAFYHTDLRARNVLMLENGDATLIDYGAIETHIKRKEKYHIYYGFLVFAYEVIHRTDIQDRRFNPFYVLVNGSDSFYYQWLQHILSIPPKEWSFQIFFQKFKDFNTKIIGPNSVLPRNDFQAWLHQIDSLIKNKQLRLRRFKKLFRKQLSYHLLEKKRWYYRFLNFPVNPFLSFYDRLILSLRE